MIAIIDYKIGNVKSIYNMLKKIGLKSIITADIEEIKKCDKYILAGVGAFDYGISNLKNADFFTTLEEEVLVNKKPILGICLGMQLLTHSSEEGTKKGLGWIDAYTKKFNLEDKSLAIPHMGWNRVKVVDNKSIFNSLQENRFYFVHSYYVECVNQSNILGLCSYGQDFVCSINYNNIYGVQFHPEKSHKFGMQLLENFGEL